MFRRLVARVSTGAPSHTSASLAPFIATYCTRRNQHTTSGVGSTGNNSSTAGGGVLDGSAEFLYGGCSSPRSVPPPISIETLRRKYLQRVPLTSVTAYDSATAMAAASGGADMILVGDSLGNVLLGYASTVPVTVQDMAQSVASVARAKLSRKPFIVVDLPFGSYITVDTALQTSVQLLKAGCGRVDAVKLEGGAEFVDRVEALVRNGILVMGHVGLTPQTAAMLGGYGAQGRTLASAKRIVDDALALQAAGCFALVLEYVPSDLAALITEKLSIPTIGIGAGGHTSGQILVMHDLLEMLPGSPVPRFVGTFDQIGLRMADGVQRYVDDVVSRKFPSNALHSVAMDPKILAEVEKLAFEANDAARHDATNSSVFDTLPSSAVSAGLPLRHKPMPLPAKMAPSSCTGVGGPAVTATSHVIRSVALVGAGAIGSLLASYLSKLSGVDLYVITKSEEQASALQKRGLVVITERGSTQRMPIRASTLATMPSKVDLVCITVKAGAVEEAYRSAARQLVNAGGTILVIHNGMAELGGVSATSCAADTHCPAAARRASSSEEDGRAAVPQHSVVKALTSYGATPLDIGVVRLAGTGDIWLYGDAEESAGAVVHLLRSAKLSVHALPSAEAFHRAQWIKLAVNAAVNPVAALLDAPNGLLRTHPTALRLMSGIIKEVVLVANGHGIQPPLVEDEVRGQVSRILAAASANTCSMAVDVRRGRSTEVRMINGYIAARADALGLSAPLSRSMTVLIEKLAATRGESDVTAETSQGSPCRAVTAGSSSNGHSHVIRCLRTVEEVRAVRREARMMMQTVGFVPTMGALHDGHLHLARCAMAKTDIVIVSIFVNPTQFAPTEDLSKYPRTLAADMEKLKRIGVQYVFAPSVETMYPTAANNDTPAIAMRVDVPDAVGKTEGAMRPNHFSGVATVCLKLFNIVAPDVAFFGQKDAQQCATILQLVQDFNIPLSVEIVPTVREPDGLAMSSRNVFLSDEERRAGRVLYRTLTFVEEKIRSRVAEIKKKKEEDESTVLPPAHHPTTCLSAAGTEGLLSISALLMEARQKIEREEPLAKFQYITLADVTSMVELTGELTAEHLRRGVCVAVAAFFGRTRLIDNLVIRL